MRFLLVLVMAVVAGQMILATTASLERCSVVCADDGPDGRCAPDCADCLCCANGVPSPLAMHTVSVDLARTCERVRIGEHSRVPSRSPADVFHVPKLVLA